MLNHIFYIESLKHTWNIWNKWARALGIFACRQYNGLISILMNLHFAYF